MSYTGSRTLSCSPIPQNWSSASPVRAPIVISKWRICPNLFDPRLSFVVTLYIVRDFYDTTTSTAAKRHLMKVIRILSTSITVFLCRSFCQNVVGAAKKCPSCNQVDLPIKTGFSSYISYGTPRKRH